MGDYNHGATLTGALFVPELGLIVFLCRQNAPLVPPSLRAQDSASALVGWLGFTDVSVMSAFIGSPNIGLYIVPVAINATGRLNGSLLVPRKQPRSTAATPLHLIDRYLPCASIRRRSSAADRSL